MIFWIESLQVNLDICLPFYRSIFEIFILSKITAFFFLSKEFMHGFESIPKNIAIDSKLTNFQESYSS